MNTIKDLLLLDDIRHINLAYKREKWSLIVFRFKLRDKYTLSILVQVDCILRWRDFEHSFNQSHYRYHYHRSTGEPGDRMKLSLRSILSLAWNHWAEKELSFTLLSIRVFADEHQRAIFVFLRRIFAPPWSRNQMKIGRRPKVRAHFARTTTTFFVSRTARSLASLGHRLILYFVIANTCTTRPLSCAGYTNTRVYLSLALSSSNIRQT